MGSTPALRRRWKNVELAIAARLGGERVPVTGRARGWAPDVHHVRWAIEVKSRKSQLLIITEMMDQARRAADWYDRRGEGPRIPIGIYHVANSRLDSALVFMRMDDFERLAAGPSSTGTEGLA